MSDKVPCRTPAKGRDGVTNIPRWKFDLMRTHILAILGQAGPKGFAFADLSAAVGARLLDDERRALGSIGWHVTTVKLELEVAGEVLRIAGPGPQRLALT